MLGFLSALMVFLALFFLSNRLLDHYFSVSSFIYDAENPYINDLNIYIEKENLSATDTVKLNEWAYKKRISHFVISRDRHLLYDSAYS